MDLIGLIASYGAWAWIVAGVVLLALELALPGGFFLWMGISGVVTGLVTMVQPMDGAFQFLLFGALSLITILVWLRYWKGRVLPSDRPFLNERAQKLVGQEAELVDPIQSGFGRVRLGDATWRVAGPDLPAGERVRIVGYDGALLRVEAVQA